MIKTKNIVMLILSTILTINIMFISAFASTGGTFDGPTSDYFNFYNVDTEFVYSSIDEIYEEINFDFFPISFVYQNSNTGDFSTNMDRSTIEQWYSLCSNLNEIIFYTVLSDGDVGVYYLAYNLDESTLKFDGQNLVLNNNTSDTVHFVYSAFNFDYIDGLYKFKVSHTNYTGFGYLPVDYTHKYPNNTNYTPIKLISSNADIYDTSGDLVVNGSSPKNKINFEVKINSALDWFQVIAFVDENVTEFDDYYTWGIDGTPDNGVLDIVYLHDSFFSSYEKNGAIFKTKSKTHLLTYQSPMISTVLLETLYGGENPILTFGTEYKVYLIRYSISDSGVKNYEPLSEYSATISFNSFNDYEIEYSGNAELDINGEIYFNYQGYNGIYSNTDVNFDNAINDFEKITNTEWSPNLMSGLTVVRGLFDDIIDSLGLVDIIMIILTLGLVGWFLGRKMRG